MQEAKFYVPYSHVYLTCVSNKKTQLAFHNKKFFFFMQEAKFYLQPCIKNLK
jgi:hypothetical protein